MMCSCSLCTFLFWDVWVRRKASCLSPLSHPRIRPSVISAVRNLKLNNSLHGNTKDCWFLFFTTGPLFIRTSLQVKP